MKISIAIACLIGAAFAQENTCAMENESCQEGSPCCEGFTCYEETACIPDMVFKIFNPPQQVNDYTCMNEGEKCSDELMMPCCVVGHLLLSCDDGICKSEYPGNAFQIPQ